MGFGSGNYFRGKSDCGGRFRGPGACNANINSVQCQIYYKTGHDANYCYYRHTHDPYGSNTYYGAPATYGKYGPNQSNVWTQPGYKAPNHPHLQQSPPMSPSLSSQYSGPSP